MHHIHIHHIDLTTFILNQCVKGCVGETSRLLQAGAKEHLSRNSSTIHEYCQLTGNSVDANKTKVLATEKFKRRLKEVIEIRLRKPSLNRDNSFEL